MPHLFLDVDGVMADFDAHVAARFGHSPTQVDPDALWRRVAADSGFWSEIPLKEGAEEIWALARDHEPTFLTGCPRSDYERAARAKRLWLARHFGDAPVITCLSRDKARHMRARGDILLDDFVVNIRRWERAGGRAILYRGPRQALRDLGRALGRS